MELHDYQEVATLIKVAMSAGGRQVSRTTFEWDVSNGCSSPVIMEFTGRPAADDGEKYVIVKPGSSHTLTLEMWVACRRCEYCLRRRRRLDPSGGVRDFAGATNMVRDAYPATGSALCV